jgi:hypothetical protein
MMNLTNEIMKTLKQVFLVGLPIALLYSLTWVFPDPVGRRMDAVLFLGECSFALIPIRIPGQQDFWDEAEKSLLSEN